MKQGIGALMETHPDWKTDPAKVLDFALKSIAVAFEANNARLADQLGPRLEELEKTHEDRLSELE
jgi:hypothetical protein